MALTDGIHNYCVYNWRVDCGDRLADNTKQSSPGNALLSSLFLLVSDIFPLSFSPFFCPLFLSYNDHCSAAGCEYKFGLFPKDEGCHSSYIKCEHGKPTEVCKMKLFLLYPKNICSGADAVRGGEPERAGDPGTGVRPLAALLQLAGPAPAQGLRPQREAGGLHLPLPRR